MKPSNICSSPVRSRYMGISDSFRAPLLTFLALSLVGPALAQGGGEQGISKEQRIEAIYMSRFGIDPDPRLMPIAEGDGIIAGEDDRKDLYQLTSDADGQLQRHIAQASPLLTNTTRLTPNPSGGFNLSVQAFRRQGFPPCAGERFPHQQLGGWCSGFLVAADIVVTAGHCVENDVDAGNTAFVFGFHADSPTTQVNSFSADQVYTGKKLLAHELSNQGDYAVVRLDRAVPVSIATPLKVRSSGALGLGAAIGLVGYPSGLPVKVAYGDSTAVMSVKPIWYTANLDSYGGNSGSPVLNNQGDKGLVEGILVRGARDYNIDFANSCFESNRIRDNQGSEVITRASVFVDKIPTD